MNLQEAKGLLSKLDGYKGQVMQPFNYPVKDFVILPAEQKEFDMMLKDIAENHSDLDTAIRPYQNNVRVIVYFDLAQNTSALKHCDVEYFIKSNTIKV